MMYDYISFISNTYFSLVANTSKLNIYNIICYVKMYFSLVATSSPLHHLATPLMAPEVLLFFYAVFIFFCSTFSESKKTKGMKGVILETAL